MIPKQKLELTQIGSKTGPAWGVAVIDLGTRPSHAPKRESPAEFQHAGQRLPRGTSGEAL